jgi:hypothetical protein
MEAWSMHLSDNGIGHIAGKHGMKSGTPAVRRQALR